MKKKFLFMFIFVCLFILGFGVMSVSAETYGDLTYSISDEKVTITDCAQSVTMVEIPNEIEGFPVETIDNYAFESCINLTNITIPDSVTTIGTGAFKECTNLMKVDLPSSLTAISSGMFYDCTSLIDIKIPNSVASIGNQAFSGCNSLKQLTIPNSVTSVGWWTFFGCGITDVYITDIAAWCNIDFSDRPGQDYSNPMEVADNLYFNGNLITALVIPNGVTQIKSNTFKDVESITSITIPDSVECIGNYTFSGCSKLTDLTIPNSITSIGYGAFSYCTRLKNVNITDLVSWCGIEFFDGDSNPLRYGDLYINNELIENITISQEITDIKEYAFYGYKKLKELKISDSVINIYRSSFYGCSNLNKITIEKGISTIVTNAFYGCNNVDTVYYNGSEDEWDSIIIGSGNDCLTNRNIITFGVVIPKTYIFVTNGGTVVSNIDGEISECPITERKNYEFMGWYDNDKFVGEPIKFPYSGTKTILYAKWQPIIYTETLLLASTQHYDIYTIMPTNIPIGSRVIFACYCNNKLTYLESIVYADENPIYFVEQSVGDYDTVKIMVWDSLNSMKPVCDTEEITITQ